MAVNTRPTLGPLVAAECLQQMRLHFEDLAGRGPVLGAGRMRGAGLIESLGHAGSKPSDDVAKKLLADALGIDGTRLCIVTEFTSNDDDEFVVKLVEGACSFEQNTDTAMCAYTLGVFIGAIGSLIGHTMTGKETECQAAGDDTCTYKIKRHIAMD